MQVFIQNRGVGHVLGSTEKLTPPLLLRILAQTPLLNRIPARLIGLGFRPEHITASEIATPTKAAGIAGA